MPTLEEIFKGLKQQADSGNGRRGQNGIVYVDRIVKLPGLQRFTLKINYASDGHYSLVFYRAFNPFWDASRLLRQPDANDAR